MEETTPTKFIDPIDPIDTTKQSEQNSDTVSKKTTVIEDIGDIWADVLDCVDRNSSTNTNLVKSEMINISGDIFDEVLHYHEPVRKDEKKDSKSTTSQSTIQNIQNTKLNTNKKNKHKFTKLKI
ncbi:MAG: hypothetical protein Terrestrivirus3_74 [Terrestrivirus sp.]|uniref:Uncharacterized protein n=1 Tax=Terrestrivirus sp. TaxID=2487775 RepID=A0A3G4ZLT8_9VIRU|nr:MAG: hypothetical protein Terrestrivirus3_74 [Terrestrivirus sp.]